MMIRGSGRAKTPTAEEIVALRKANGHTSAFAASLIHTSAARWDACEAGQRRMHPAFWELYQIKAAQLRPND